MLTGGQTGGRAGGQEDRLAGGRERANGRTRGECRAIILIRRLNTGVRIKWHLALVPSLMACRTDKVGETARAQIFFEVVYIVIGQRTSASGQLNGETSTAGHVPKWRQKRVDGMKKAPVVDGS